MLCLTSAMVTAAEPPSAELVEVTRIWDKAHHNAFTDLLRFQDRWYCVFREGQGHVSPDGALRVITSADGKTWESAALITSEDSDLRDAKITITPDGQLMLSGAEAMNQPVGYKHQSLTWLSPDGKTWGPANEVADRDFWLWRTTWHKGTPPTGSPTAAARKKGSIRLHTSKDGKTFDTLVKNACDDWLRQRNLHGLPRRRHLLLPPPPRRFKPSTRPDRCLPNHPTPTGNGKTLA